MVVDVFNMEGKKVGTAELPEAIFNAEIFVDLMHQAFVRQMANARLGTHQTKVRGEVSGGGRKPWRQKGTGRARQGSIRAAHWKGGGRIHTPHPRSYAQAMPLKMRRAALRSALSVKAAEANIVVVDKLELAEPKTRLMAKALNVLVGDAKALIVIPQKESFEGVVRSTNNLPDAKILLANYLNIRDLLKYEKLILPLASLDTISNNLG
ncbi:50S ribosomal protein L4 [Levilinea saccharolytica]|uniref:Large ribosomal subunit protein uL4 n=2 Tax=Levilinea saccharolytica TaxID=229921 RepID=A0A0P6YF77_9CHLR|nr:50S ribosomal protein L4 [Levilinea saccharolytica]KPL83613.1 50S ribosomal protein L4 [Levilinea saccharolytica]GAP18663.1 50S ribosomal protein L4, bacterial/organelle [Levilinea saccharolytica]